MMSKSWATPTTFIRTTRKGHPLLDAILREILVQPVPAVTSSRWQSSPNRSRLA